MKTRDVLEKLLKGKRLSERTKIQWRYVLSLLEKYSEEWPESGVVIDEWLAGLKVSDISANLYFCIVNTAGNYMRKAYGISNPCDTANKPKVLKRRRRYFTPDEVMRVLGACRYGYDRELVFTLADSLCRISELSGLRGRDVGDGFIDTVGKTGQGRYRLDGSLCEALRRLAGSPDGYVFIDRDGKPASRDTLGHGKPASPGTLGRRVSRVMIRAGLTGKRLGPHTLRHTGASLVARATGSALAVKALLQHGSIATSMTYIHDVEEDYLREISPLQLISEASSLTRWLAPVIR